MQIFSCKVCSDPARTYQLGIVNRNITAYLSGPSPDPRVKKALDSFRKHEIQFATTTTAIANHYREHERGTAQLFRFWHDLDSRGSGDRNKRSETVQGYFIPSAYYELEDKTSNGKISFGVYFDKRARHQKGIVFCPWCDKSSTCFFDKLGQPLTDPAVFARRVSDYNKHITSCKAASAGLGKKPPDASSSAPPSSSPTEGRGKRKKGTTKTSEGVRTVKGLSSKFSSSSSKGLKGLEEAGQRPASSASSSSSSSNNGPSLLGKANLSTLGKKGTGGRKLDNKASKITYSIVPGPGSPCSSPSAFGASSHSPVSLGSSSSSSLSSSHYTGINGSSSSSSNPSSSSSRS